MRNCTVKRRALYTDNHPYPSFPPLPLFPVCPLPPASPPRSVLLATSHSPLATRFSSPRHFLPWTTFTYIRNHLTKFHPSFIIFSINLDPCDKSRYKRRILAASRAAFLFMSYIRLPQSSVQP